MIPRTKSKFTKGGCADCGASEVGWASLNRGILICNECCSVHRSLGRHISQVKSLKYGYWPAQQLKMVQLLNSNGANNIWEHSLWDPSYGKSPRRKPDASDQLHPTKAEFIRSKHQTLAYVYRPGKDDRQLTDGDCSLQLHSSVRTANIETSLRLLSLAANPNYTHPDRGTCPLHVAARAGQSLQTELLLVYGADPARPNRAGHTPEQVAREAGHGQLADRLAESQFELTDRLSQYVSGQRPGQRLLTPTALVNFHQLELPAARQHLQQLSDQVFAELCADVYDELDRRENDQHWLLHCPPSSKSSTATLTPTNNSMYNTVVGTVPFLPVNPAFSSTRNQGRQKLARCSRETFLTLIVDLLLEARRRQFGPEPAPSTDEGAEPLYDTVPLEPDVFEGAGEGFDRCTVLESDYAELSDVVVPGSAQQPGTGAEAACSQANISSPTITNAALRRESSRVQDEDSKQCDFSISNVDSSLCSDKADFEVDVSLDTVRRRHKQPVSVSQTVQVETLCSSSDSRHSQLRNGGGSAHNHHQLETEQLRSMVESLTLPNSAHQAGSEEIQPGSILDCPARPSTPVGARVAPNSELEHPEYNLKRRSLQCGKDRQRLVTSACETPAGDQSGCVSDGDYYSLPVQLSPAPSSPPMHFPRSHRSRPPIVASPSPPPALTHSHRSQQVDVTPSSPPLSLPHSNRSRQPVITPSSPSLSSPHSHRSHQPGIAPSSPPVSSPYSHRSQQPVVAPSSPPSSIPHIHRSQQPVVASSTPQMSLPHSQRSQQPIVAPSSPSLSLPHDHRSQQPVVAPPSPPVSPSLDSLPATSGPSQESVLQCTEQITRRIQCLLGSAQNGRCAEYGERVSDIHLAVQDMVSVFPSQEVEPEAERALQQLTECSGRLYDEGNCDLTGGLEDPRLVTQRLIQLAFLVAKAAKRLVTLYQ